MDDGPSSEELFRWLMNQPQGRAVLKLIAATSGVMADVFNQNNSQMSFNAGRRSVGVEVLQLAKSANPDQFNKFIGDIL